MCWAYFAEKLQYQRGFSAIFSPKGAPVLDFGFEFMIHALTTEKWFL
jgi:hypothetical protein